MSLRDDFEDSGFWEAIGDPVELIYESGKSEVIYGAFGKEYLPEELGGTIGVESLTLRVDEYIADKIPKNTKAIIYKKNYKTVEKHVLDELTTIIILKYY